jgi:hypothetical protein
VIPIQGLRDALDGRVRGLGIAVPPPDLPARVLRSSQLLRNLTTATKVTCSMNATWFER